VIYLTTPLLDYLKGSAAMRRRPVIRKAIKSALIAKAATRLAHRAEKHLEKKVEHRLGKQ
jgi:hypothetical protein